MPFKFEIIIKYTHLTAFCQSMCPFFQFIAESDNIHPIGRTNSTIGMAWGSQGKLNPPPGVPEFAAFEIAKEPTRFKPAPFHLYTI
jgi:hypothetical protein